MFEFGRETRRVKRETRRLEKTNQKIEQAVKSSGRFASDAMRYDENPWDHKGINIGEVPKEFPSKKTEAYMQLVGQEAIRFYRNRTGNSIHYLHDESILRTVEHNPIDPNLTNYYPEGLRLVFSKSPPTPAHLPEVPEQPKTLY